MSEHITTETSNKAEKQALKEAKRRKRIVLFNWISALVVLAAIAWGITVFFHLNNSAYTDDAQVDAYINPINVRIPGYIKEIRFREHQSVHKGDTLVLIEDEEYKLRVAEASAALADAQAAKNVSLSGVDIASNGINVSNANLEELKARLENMETNYHRYERLLAADVVTQYQFDEVKTELDAMRARYEALKAQHTNSQLNTDETRKKISVSDANVLRAQAALDLARLNLSYTVIRAPYDGVLGRKIIEEGQYVQAGQSLGAIVRGDEKWVTANYTERQLKSIALGKEVEMTVDALPGKHFYGIISAISEATGSKYSAVPVDNSTGNFVKVQQRIPVRIDFNQKNKKEEVALLRAGMNVVVKK